MKNQFKVILHIGLPKTGTTAFQKACEKETELLANQGFGYYKGFVSKGVQGATELTISSMRPDFECMAAWWKRDDMSFEDYREYRP